MGLTPVSRAAFWGGGSLSLICRIRGISRGKEALPIPPLLEAPHFCRHPTSVGSVYPGQRSSHRMGRKLSAFWSCAL